MAFNPNDDEPVWDLVDFRSRGNEVSPFRGRVKDQLMRQLSHTQFRQVNTLNQQFGNNYTYHFNFGQPSPQSNTTRTLPGIRNSHPDHDDRPERTNSRTRRESEVATSQNDDSKCKVCLDNTADCVILMCGHYVCDSCGQRLKSNDSLCHICRQPIQDIIKTYRS